MRNMLAILAWLWVLPGLAAVVHGDGHLYQITLLRAAPGHLPQLIDAVRKQRNTLHGGQLIMRHSQGDQWDLMLLTPQSDTRFERFHYTVPVSYQSEFIASSPTDWTTIQARAKHANLLHIEMFHALAGKENALLVERSMENRYLEATARHGNIIFKTEFGSDVDCFTLGLYLDLAAFAADPPLPAAAFEKAARDAGFKSRSALSFFLRTLIDRHHDTLATQVR